MAGRSFEVFHSWTFSSYTTSRQHIYLLRNASACFDFKVGKPISDVWNVVFAYKSDPFTVDQFTYFQSIYYGVVPFISPICNGEIIKAEKPQTKGQRKKKHHSLWSTSPLFDNLFYKNKSTRTQEWILENFGSVKSWIQCKCPSIRNVWIIYGVSILWMTCSY